MRSAACAAIPLALALVLVAMPGDARAAERARARIPYQAIDAQGMVVTQLFPRAHFGGDIAYVIGNETFQARFGAQAAGGRTFSLGPGRIGNTLAVFSMDACGAKKVFRHRVRMCMGGQGGMLAHHWHGYDRPGRKATPYVAGVLKGDYSYFIRESFAMMFGVGVTIPVVGPEFRARNSNGALSSVVFPGPVTGVVTFGGSFRL